MGHFSYGFTAHCGGSRLLPEGNGGWRLLAAAGAVDVDEGSFFALIGATGAKEGEQNQCHDQRRETRFMVHRLCLDAVESSFRNSVSHFLLRAVASR